MFFKHPRGIALYIKLVCHILCNILSFIPYITSKAILFFVFDNDPYGRGGLTLKCHTESSSCSSYVNFLTDYQCKMIMYLPCTFCIVKVSKADVKLLNYSFFVCTHANPKSSQMGTCIYPSFIVV